MEQLCHGSGGVFSVKKHPPGRTESLHRPVKFPGGELLYGLLQVCPLPLQPGLGGEMIPLTERGRQLYRRAGRLLQHQRFQRLEVPATHMAGEAGDRGVGELQPLGQLADGRKQESIRVGVDIVQDLLLRPGQFPGRVGRCRSMTTPSFFQNCLQRAVEPPVRGQQRPALPEG